MRADAESTLIDMICNQLQASGLCPPSPDASQAASGRKRGDMAPTDANGDIALTDANPTCALRAQIGAWNGLDQQTGAWISIRGRGLAFWTLD